jgi:hypothetical protein
VYDPSQR